MNQGELIPLSPEERAMRGPMLARLTLELLDMQAEHAEEKKVMAARELEARQRIHKIARSIRDGRKADEP
jgi:hypothetical protein